MTENYDWVEHYDTPLLDLREHDLDIEDKRKRRGNGFLIGVLTVSALAIICNDIYTNYNNAIQGYDPNSHYKPINITPSTIPYPTSSVTNNPNPAETVVDRTTPPSSTVYWPKKGWSSIFSS